MKIRIVGVIFIGDVGNVAGMEKAAQGSDAERGEGGFTEGSAEGDSDFRGDDGMQSFAFVIF